LAQDSPPGFDDYAAQIQQQGYAALVVGMDVPGYQVEATGQVGIAAAQEAAIAAAARAMLDRLSAYAISDVKTYSYLPAVALRVNSLKALEAVYGDPGVASIEPDLIVAPALEQSVPKIRAPDAHALLYDGTGVAVAILDTGVDKTHPALAGKVISEACFSGGSGASVCPGGGASSTASGSGVHCPANIAACDHGTHVAGIVAGVAPDADLISIQVFSRVDDTTTSTPCADSNRTSPCSLSSLSDILSGLNRVLALSGSINIAAVNLSLGSGQYTASCSSTFATTTNAVNALRNVGINVVIAAGNDGYRNAMGWPACIFESISVGATDDLDNVTSFSNVSNVTSLFAPGKFIRAAVPGSAYGLKDGTSMAAPHAAGAVAVLKEARPGNDVATANAIKNALIGSGVNVPDNRAGGSITKPRLDVYAALCNPVILSCDSDDFRTILLNQTLSGSLPSTTDRDIYIYNGVAGSKLTVAINRVSGTLDPYVEVVDPNGVVVAFNDNGGSGTNALINGYTLATTGRYLITARAANNSFTTGSYTLALSPLVAVVANPAPVLAYLSPPSASGALGGAGFWVRVYGQNFLPTTELYLNGAPRPRHFTSSGLVWIWVNGTDLNLPWPRTAFVQAHNPAPGGGFSNTRSFNITFPTLGTSELVAPPPDTTVTTGISTTFVISWTAPLTKSAPSTTTVGVTETVPVTTWRSMQNMDLRLRDTDGNVAAWIRVVERPGATSVYRLLDSADTTTPVTSTTGITPTLPVEGLPGENRNLVITDTVTLHLLESDFKGSGLTAVMTPVVTFGPNAVGAYNIEFRVDDEYGQVQDEDILGQITIAPPTCVPLTSVALSGPSSAAVGADVAYSAAIDPVGATAPVTYTWAPAPKSGQGAPNAVYNFATAGTPFVFVSAENCGGFVADLKQVQVSSSTEPFLPIVLKLPATTPASSAGVQTSAQDATGVITATITVSNTGAQTATNVLIGSVLPSGATHLSGGSVSNGTVFFNIPALGGFGQSVVVSYSFSLAAAQTPGMTLTAGAYFVSADGVAQNNGAAPASTKLVNAQTTLTFDTAATLSYVAAGQASTTIEVLPGAVADETILVATELSSPSVALPGGRVFAGRAFRLEAYQGNQLVPNFQLGEAISLTVGYTDSGLGGGDEAQAALFYLDGSTWKQDGLTCAPQPSQNRLVCSLEDPRLAEFALTVPQAPVEEGFHLHLPSLFR
jgi:uncharacterized repeat protein (TIGR01451 family)